MCSSRIGHWCKDRVVRLVILQLGCIMDALLLITVLFRLVLVLMYIMYPIAYPTALLLDYFLGESHGTVYKKAGKFANHYRGVIVC